jgi:deoxyribonuclease-4
MDIGFSINSNDINENEIKKLKKTFNSIQIMILFDVLKFDKNVNNKYFIEIKNIKKILSSFKNIYIHASYKINIGSELILSNNNFYNIGIDIIINEIKIAKYIGSNGIILHLGKNTIKTLNDKTKKSLNDKNVYNNMIIFIIELFKKLKKQKLLFNILFETPAGQKGDICYDLIEFVNFILSFKNMEFYKYINICIDTCHIFQAGYNLNDDKILNNVFKIFNPVFNKVKLIHLNNSKYDFNNKKDRHEQINKGFINVSSLKKIINNFNGIPLVLETEGPYEKQINVLLV